MAKSRYDKTIEEYNALGPRLYTALISLKLAYAPNYLDGSPNLELEMELSSHANEPGTRLYLHCTGVQGLKFTPTFGPPYRLSQLEISSIHHRQWENLHYLVQEVEHGDIHFFCKEFTAFAVEAPAPSDA